MPIKVELKARITDPATVSARLRGWADGEPSTYADTYYDFPDRRLTETGRQEMRLRVIDKPGGRKVLWTFKGAMLDAASTPEWETEVADPQPADAILTGLGMTHLIAYTKRCENFRFTAHGHPILATLGGCPGDRRDLPGSGNRDRRQHGPRRGAQSHPRRTLRSWPGRRRPRSDLLH
jgi:adenylate cyclase class 2